MLDRFHFGFINTALAAQSWLPTVDKALSTDPITLLALAVLIIVVTYLATVWLTGRKDARDDRFQEMMFTALTDEKSPLVKSNNNVADSNLKIAAALEKLGEKTDTQTSHFEGMRSDNKTFQGLITTDLSRQTETIAGLSSTVTALTSRFDTGMAEIRTMLSQRVENTVDRVWIETQMQQFKTSFKAELLDELLQFAKRVTSTTKKVEVDIVQSPSPPSSLPTEAPASPPKEKES